MPIARRDLPKIGSGTSWGVGCALTSLEVGTVWVDSGSVVASCHRNVMETCLYTSGKREPHQILQTVAIVERRRPTFVVEGNYKDCDHPHVGGHLEENMRVTFALNAESRDWVNAWSAGNRLAIDGGVNETANDNEVSPGSSNGHQTDVYPCPCASFYPSSL